MNNERWFFIWQNLKRMERGEAVSLTSSEFRFFDYVASNNTGDMEKHIRASLQYLRLLKRQVTINDGTLPFLVGFESALELLLCSAQKKRE